MCGWLNLCVCGRLCACGWLSCCGFLGLCVCVWLAGSFACVVWCWLGLCVCGRLKLCECDLGCVCVLSVCGWLGLAVQHNLGLSVCGCVAVSV